MEPLLTDWVQGTSTAEALRFHRCLVTTPRRAGGMEERLAQMEAEAEIRDLLVSYSVHYDARDLEGLVDLFAEDAVVRNLLGEHAGRAAIRTNFEFLIDHMGASMHFVTNVTVRVDAPHRARAASYLDSIAVRRLDGYAYGTCGTYSDRLEVRDGRWRIVERMTTGTIPYDLKPTPSDYDRFALTRNARE